jgi:hypothetical protein
VMRQACHGVLVMVVAAGCGASGPSGDRDPVLVSPTGPALPGFPDLPIDGGSIDAPPPDAPPPDAPPPDAPPPDLTRICDVQPVTLDDWEDCYRKRLCDALVGCSSENPFLDAQECFARVDDLVAGQFSAERRERTRAVEQARASLDGPRFTQCLFDLSHEFCDTAGSSVACATRFDGTIGDGGGCFTDIDCRSPGATCESSCSDAEACCPGTCRPKLRLGQTCRFSDECEPGLECHGTCVSGDIGTTCKSDDDCDPSAWCNAGRCAAHLAPEATCSRLAQCGGETTCVGLSILDSRPGHCLRISHPGDHCDFACFGNLYCDSSGTCRDLPELGQSCPGSIPCRGIDAFCSGGQCELLGDLGARCTSSSSCRPGSFCNSELNDPNPMCIAPGGTDQPCTDPGQCESFLCSGSPGKPGSCVAWSDTCPPSGG